MEKHCYSIRYVWEIPVRVTHWINVITIVTLATTGYFIGNPQSLALSPESFIMGWVRFVHFMAAYVFTISVLARLYWSLVGNKYAGWRNYFPWISATGRQRMADTLRYYLFLSKKVPHVVGHNPMALVAYSVLMVLFLLMILSGFALYAQYAPGSFLQRVTSPLFLLFSNQTVRLGHHFIMWLIIGFVIQHIYTCWLMDVKERGGIFSSIFSGYKTVEDDE